MTPAPLVALPADFEPDIYRALHGDLRAMSDQELATHYAKYGVDEGRRAHSITNRLQFAALARDLDVLELGPFNTPLLQGPTVRYFDILDREGLIARAQSSGTPAEGVPERIHFVSASGDLSVVEGKFDAVLSSHVVEHQPDLVRHLQAVERLLRPGGAYLLLVPDKRYCFDHYFAPSSIGAVLDAYYSRRCIHSLSSQIEHVALTTHNDPVRHWAGDHGTSQAAVDRIRETLERYRAEPDRYVDVHAWYFTPATFDGIITSLRELGLVSLRVSHSYPTLYGKNEFWVVLEAAGA